MNREIKVVISDLDGTLLNENHQLGEYTKKVIRMLQKKGIHFWIATGRHHCDALNIRNKIGVDALLITANGATVSDYMGVLEDQATLERKIVESILGIEVPNGVYQNLYQGSHWLMETKDEVFANYYQEGDFKYTLCNFEDHLDQPINKIFYTSLSHEALKPLAETIIEKYGEHVEVTFSMPECLEIMPKGVNKGTAIAQTLKKYGFLKEEVVAFGDGLNDYEMLKLLDHGMIMGNANPELLKRLPHRKVIGKNSEESVAKWLEAHFDLKALTSA